LNTKSRFVSVLQPERSFPDFPLAVEPTDLGAQLKWTGDGSFGLFLMSESKGVSVDARFQTLKLMVYGRRSTSVCIATCVKRRVRIFRLPLARVTSHVVLRLLWMEVVK